MEAVTAPVTRASDHVPEDAVEAYCDIADVRLILAGVEPDDAGTELSGWLSQVNADAVIALYLLDKKARIDTLAGRDFDVHEDVDVVLDGSGNSVLNVSDAGFWPLIDVTSVAINGQTQSTDDFVYYRSGIIKADMSSSITYVNPTICKSFPRGTQNVALTLSWGFPVVPVAIRLAQAKLTAAEVLSHIARANTQSPGMVGGMQRIEYDEFKITNFQRSRFGAAIESLISQATQTAMGYRSFAAISLIPGNAGNSGDVRDDVFARSGRVHGVSLGEEPA